MDTLTKKQDGGLLELRGHLHARDGGPGLGLDALDHRAAAAALLLLIGHDFTVCIRPSSRPAHLPQQLQRVRMGAWRGGCRVTGELTSRHLLASRRLNAISRSR